MIRVRIEAIKGRGEVKDKRLEKRERKEHKEEKYAKEGERIKITPREHEGYLM